MKSINSEIEARLNQCKKPDDGMVDCVILDKQDLIRMIRNFAVDCVWDTKLQDKLLEEDEKYESEID